MGGEVQHNQDLEETWAQTAVVAVAGTASDP